MHWEKGWLWETVLSRAFGGKAAIRVGEVEMDGVVGSPDGIGFDTSGNAYVEEYKCTSMGVGKTPANMWRWMMQAKGYCRMVGATRCIFRVLHLTFPPTYRVWELVFTEEELAENWAAIMAQAQVMRREGVDGDHGNKAV